MTDARPDIDIIDAVDILERSALVVAHPDDEALWFSSILGDVGEILICYRDVTSRPDWTRGRRESLGSYPLGNMHALGLSESEVFDGASWPEPMPEEYGLRVTRSTGSSSAFSVSRYAANFDRLKTELRTRLVGRKNVFTHNPWGEYGHEEHVQVFRAVEALQGEFGFRLWCSNYYSNKSYGLMVGSMAQVEGVHRSFRTRVDLAASLKELYTRTGCWTWYPDYRWPDHEAFIAWSGEARAQPKEGGVVPMNAVRVRFRKRRKISSRWSPGQVWRRARTRLTGSWSRTPSIETPGRVA